MTSLNRASTWPPLAFFARKRGVFFIGWWLALRQLLGYGRFGDLKLREQVNEFYEKAWLPLRNHFTPERRRWCGLRFGFGRCRCLRLHCVRSSEKPY